MWSEVVNFVSVIATAVLGLAVTALSQLVSKAVVEAYWLKAAEKPPLAVTVPPVLALIVAHSLGVKASLTVMLIVSVVSVPKVAASEPTAPETSIDFSDETVAVIVPVPEAWNRVAILLTAVMSLAVDKAVPLLSIVIARSVSLA